MTATTATSPRRTEPLSRAGIVQAAIGLLDAGGESALTARSLTSHFATGRGAIYHHVPNMGELLAAAAESVMAAATQSVAQDADPAAAMRALALQIFDAVDQHPWVGAQLSRDPVQPAVLHVWTGIGAALTRLGVAESTLPTAGAALSNYIYGSTAQYAAGARRALDDDDRQRYLDAAAVTWAEHYDEHLAGKAAEGLRDHDDRAQFLAGVDIFLAGIAASS